MPTTFLGMWNSPSHGKSFSAANALDTFEAIDRLGARQWYVRAHGPLAGWSLPTTAGVSEVTRGSGLIGPCICQTTASQAISNLAFTLSTLAELWQFST